MGATYREWEDVVECRVINLAPGAAATVVTTGNKTIITTRIFTAPI